MGALKILGGVVLGAACAVAVMVWLGSPLLRGVAPPAPARGGAAESLQPVSLSDGPAASTAGPGAPRQLPPEAVPEDRPLPTVEGTVQVFSGVLRATGVGLAPPDVNNPIQAREMAAGAAQLDALRKLAAHLTGCRLEAVRSVRDYRQRDYTVIESVRAVLRGARIVATRQRDNGLVEVEMEVELPSAAGEHSGPAPSRPETTL